MPTTRRTLVILALMFWQGGLLFYGSVVVPIGSASLGDTGQGFITRVVTLAINITGLAVLPVLAWDVIASGRSRGRQILWAILAATVAVLMWLHPRMDALLDPLDQTISEYRHFRHLHRWYLRVVTLQLFVGWAFVAASVRTWRHDDRTAAASAGPPQG